MLSVVVWTYFPQVWSFFLLAHRLFHIPERVLKYTQVASLSPTETAMPLGCGTVSDGSQAWDVFPSFLPGEWRRWLGRGGRCDVFWALVASAFVVCALACAWSAGRLSWRLRPLRLRPSWRFPRSCPWPRRLPPATCAASSGAVIPSGRGLRVMVFSRKRSMARNFGMSFSFTKVTARPPRPARAVRPMRCT